MKTKIISVLFTGIFALLLTTSAFSANPPKDSSNPGEWELLGRRSINWGVDHDEIAAIGQGTFSAIKIRLKGGPVNMHRVVVHYANGTQEEVEIRSVIPMNGESRVIDLNGGDRHITRVALWYDTKNRAPGKAAVAVWGKH